MNKTQKKADNKSDKKIETISSIILLLASIIVAVLLVIYSSQRALTPLESGSLQALTLLLGLTASFIFGKQSATTAAREIIKPHARSAFRRLISLYDSLSRLSAIIRKAQSSGQQSLEDKAVFDVLEAIVTGQISTADDALEDWRDIVPDEVQELRDKLGQTHTGELS